MRHTENWIWLPEREYPHNQTTVFSGEDKGGNYTVAEFEKSFGFGEKILRAKLRFSADTVFCLYCNDHFVATGPASVGGDFIGNDRPRENFYAYETEICPDSENLRFFARVQMSPYHICEFSKGHGGFMLSAILTFEDGSHREIHTDESWLVRLNPAYHAPKSYDGRMPSHEFVHARNIPNLWHTATAPIPVREEREIFFPDGTIFLPPHGEKTAIFDLDRIWAGFVHARLESAGEVHAQIFSREISEKTGPEQVILREKGEYRSFCLRSAGSIEVRAKNPSDSPAKLTFSFLVTHYPISSEAETVTDDPDLNLVLDTCKHTLKICRQTHHLDSPKHCEPLACTGDYYIESLMTPFAFGDMRLAEFDLERTAVLLERENGRMFHTTYSLIWVKMLYDVYLFTGNLLLLKNCERALGILLNRFAGYVGENGLIETPPDYMFVDWIYIDSLSLHHPPKALGQTCLNLFYFGALDQAGKIYEILGKSDQARESFAKKEALRAAVNSLLFDPERRCYFEGLNTPTDPALVGTWMPENVKKRYYLKHSNILAAYFGVCDDQRARDLVRQIMEDEIEGDCQPYFLHYLLEAVFRLGLREEYTLKICERWKPSVRACPKGLVEGFIPPEPGYTFDHSHAWGGTPLYSLPKALLGLEIIEPGMKKIRLSPSLLGLEEAKTELLTPYGKVICRMKRGEEIRLTHPPEVEIL